MSVECLISLPKSINMILIGDHLRHVHVLCHTIIHLILILMFIFNFKDFTNETARSELGIVNYIII